MGSKESLVLPTVMEHYHCPADRHDWVAGFHVRAGVGVSLSLDIPAGISRDAYGYLDTSMDIQG